MAKKIELIQINTESKLIKGYKRFLRTIRILILILTILFLFSGSLLHIYFLRNFNINFNQIPISVVIFMFTIILFFIVFIFLLYFYPKNLNKVFESSDREFNSLISSLDLLIFELEPFLDSLVDHPFSKEIKETISIHRHFIDFIFENKYDYNLLISFTKYFINIETVILNELLKEKNDEIDYLKSLIGRLRPFKYSDIILKIFPDWHYIIEEKMDQNISKLSLGIESLQKMQNQFNIEINNIESKLKNLDTLVKNITVNNTSNMENFFESFSKIIEKIYKDYEALQSNFNLISQTIETIDELSKDISVIAFNIEIEASKMKESKVFTVLAKEVRNFSNQLSEYYSSINNTISEIKKFLSSTNYNEEYMKKNIYNYLDKIEILCGEYDKAFIEVRELNQQLIIQNKENQKIFLKDVNENLQTLQKLAICLEELEHRNKFTNSIIQKAQDSISDIFQIADLSNANENKNKKNYNRTMLDELRKKITTKDETDFLKKIHKDILEEDISENQIELENKYKDIDGKDEEIIIF